MPDCNGHAHYGVGMPSKKVDVRAMAAARREPTAGPSNGEGSTSFDPDSIRSGLAKESLSLDSLTPREFLVMTRWMGLDGESRQTYVQIGHLIGLSRESIRQDVLRATRKIKETARTSLA